MQTREILVEVKAELTTAFTELSGDGDIYISPTVVEVPARRPLNLQVCENGVNYSDFEGGVRREHFELTIGILRTCKVDYSGRFQRALEGLNTSILETKEKVVTTLAGSFLTVGESPLLVRPLRPVRETRVRQGKKEKGLLIKEVTFRGGTNVLR